MIIKSQDKNAVNIAIEKINSGKVIAIPTDTTYGFACDASNAEAIESLYKIKNRSRKKPIAIFVRNIDIAKKIGFFSKVAERIFNKFSPGALTIVVPKIKDNFISKELTLKSSNIAIRIPDHSFCNKLLKNFPGILAVTSANISNEEVMIDAKSLERDFSSEISLIVDGDKCSSLASTIIMIDKDGKCELLREGLIEFKNILTEVNEPN